MTTHTTFLSEHVGRALNGPAWHGYSIGELLADVSAEEAGARPIPDGHSIAELVAHVGVWAAEVERRLGGAHGHPTEQENFPDVDTSSEDAWQAAVQLMRDRHESLAHAIARFDEGKLHDELPHRKHSAAIMVHGVVEHTAYHSGQIALLKRLVRARQ